MVISRMRDLKHKCKVLVLWPHYEAMWTPPCLHIEIVMVINRMRDLRCECQLSLWCLCLTKNVWMSGLHHVYI